MIKLKNLLIHIIDIYQKTPLNSHAKCRCIPTCSNYAKEAIETYGIFKGGKIALKRILKCNPIGIKGYDPVPRRDKK